MQIKKKFVPLQCDRGRTSNTHKQKNNVKQLKQTIMKKFNYSLNGEQVGRKDIIKLWGSAFVMTLQKRAAYFGSVAVSRYWGVTGEILNVGVSLVSKMN